MGGNTCLFITPLTVFPMGVVIEQKFTITLVAVVTDITAVYAGLITTIIESVLLITDTTATIGTTGPVVEIVIVPVVAYGVFRSMLLITGTTHLLMHIFAEIRKSGKCMLVCCCNGFAAFAITNTTNNCCSK